MTVGDFLDNGKALVRLASRWLSGVTCSILSNLLGLRLNALTLQLITGCSQYGTEERQEETMSRQSDLDNHANQLNPNNDAYWESRGHDERSDDWEELVAEEDDASEDRSWNPTGREEAVSAWMSVASPAALCRASNSTAPSTMSNGANNPNIIPAAYSGRIIGAIVKALGLDDGVLTQRTARRFFQGKSVNEPNRAEIFRALGQALVDRGIVLETDALLKRGVPMSDLLATAIAHAASRWDALIAGIQSRSAMVEGRGIVTERNASVRGYRPVPAGL